ncbi:cobalamin biosynthesis protein CobQ [Fumia xinanensis]|uniref:Cobalamin biosynthesis protein CobQ n=1 Tax=Fumia xinanensis TaxID=2763659 RepID=A0A926I8H7_9FIRM|nr:cobalamin biosynthesis protein CobQ [Fumia xinanensis]MBC8560926.1 cobalamin biosynthesis protein CobQ [Fumia xinanensis]
MFFVEKRLNIITGHYGSGKTNLAVNIALDLSKKRKKVAIIDLDIVNPYFRTADFKALFAQNQICLAAPVYAGSNLDIPALPPEIETLLSDEEITVVVDVGGDDAGAIALGRYAGLIESMDFDMFYVVNRYRLGTSTPKDSVNLMKEIEKASRLQTTAIINNSNLGEGTTGKDILDSLPYANEICRETGLPLAATAVFLQKALEVQLPMEYPIRIFVTKPWEQGPF